MKVKELIRLLQTFPADIEVLYKCCSEQMTLDKEDIKLVQLCEPRPDGWVQNARPDKQTQQYVLLPGN